MDKLAFGFFQEPCVKPSITSTSDCLQIELPFRSFHAAFGDIPEPFNVVERFDITRPVETGYDRSDAICSYLFINVAYALVCDYRQATGQIFGIFRRRGRLFGLAFLNERNREVRPAQIPGNLAC